MPTTVIGLLIFLVLLAPGLTYSTFRASSRPVVKPTALQEVSGIALRSAIFDGLALGVFAVLRTARPEATPDVGALIRTPDEYFREHYAQVTLWGTGLMALACIMALWAARVADHAGLIGALEKLGLSPQGRSSQEPAWWVLFEGAPEDSIVYAGCTLEDGTYFGGWVNSYSPDSDETADRELTLASPIQYRAAGAAVVEDLAVSAVSISARRLSYLTVTYVPEEAKDTALVGETSVAEGTSPAPATHEQVPGSLSRREEDPDRAPG